MTNQDLSKALSLARANRPLQVAVVLLVSAILIAFLVPVLPLADPARQDLSLALRPPFWIPGASPAHVLGTDYLGRDILSRVAWGSRTSLTIGFSAVAVAAAIGVPLGLVAPYFGGAVDEAIMRVFDLVLSIPAILVAIAVLAIFGASFPILILVLGLRSTVYYARTLRSRVLSIREEQYIKAARSLGLSHVRIMARHVFPNSLNPIIVLSSIYVGLMIILESNLSFLGLTKAQVSWGFMVSESLNYVATAWWGAALPGLCIFVVVLSVNVIGDFLRDVFDPRLQPRLG
jgi:peptide/nickel transport system permease protein